MRHVLATIPVEEGNEEPRINAAVHRRSDGSFEAVIVPRRAHRPSCYDEVGVSPGAIDMLGTIITLHAVIMMLLTPRFFRGYFQKWR